MMNLLARCFRGITVPLAGAALVVALTGCAKILAPQALGENLALLPGVQSNHPAFIDGDVKTGGDTTFPPSADNRFTDITPPSEAYVLFPEVKTISKITIYSDELVGFDLYVEDPTQGMKLINKYDGQKGPVINIPMKGIVRATGVRLRVRKTTNDAETRQRNIRTGTLGGRYITGNTRAPAQINEIEIFGPVVSGTTPTETAEAPAPNPNDAGSILMNDLRQSSGSATAPQPAPAKGEASKVGQAAPMFSLTTPTGGSFGLEDFIGNVVVLNFWSPTGANAASEGRTLAALRTELAVEEFEILSIVIGGDPDTVAQFIRQNKIGYPMLMGTDEVLRRYGLSVSSLPTTFLLDRQGKIVRQFKGAQSKETLQNAIRQVLNAPSPTTN